MIYKIAQKIRSIYWRVFQPSTYGVKAAVFNQAGDVLLVKLSYHDGWYLPGGGIRRQEDAQVALRRELGEEVGIRNFTSIQEFGNYLNTKEGKKDHIALFKVETSDRPLPSMGEVVEARFFSKDDLPADTSPATRRRIEELFNARPLTGEW